MNCFECKKESDTVVTIIDTTEKSICDNCLISDAVSDTNEIDAINLEIQEIQDLIVKFGELVNHEDKDIKQDTELMGFGFTPSNNLKYSELMLVEAFIKKFKLLRAMSEYEILAHALKLALKNEHFKLASEIRDRMKPFYKKK